ncbi:MAG: addiction module protein [Verrucomicrobiales bacterium]|nr:addiction module protein [Verrucomicrobiales bacterium]
MTTAAKNYDEIEETVLELPHDDRTRLASRILESLEEDDGFEVSEAWQSELNRRIKDIDECRTELIPGDEAWKRVNERFGTDFKG